MIYVFFFFVCLLFFFFKDQIRFLTNKSRWNVIQKEITTVQVFGKTAKNGLKSINVSKSHWHSLVIYSLTGYYVLLGEILKQKSNPKQNPWTGVGPRRPGKTTPSSQIQAAISILKHIREFCSRVNFPFRIHIWTATRTPLWFMEIFFFFLEFHSRHH